MKTEASKEAKSLDHVLPPSIKTNTNGRRKGTKRRQILLENMEENEVKKAKLETKVEEKRRKNMRSTHLNRSRFRVVTDYATLQLLMEPLLPWR